MFVSEIGDNGGVPGTTRDRGAGGRSRTRLKRLPERGSNDVALALEILDELGQGTVGYATADGVPRLTPTLLWRDGDNVFWHGSSASRAIRDLGKGAQCCVNVFALDGLVLARSAMHHSANYRSATLYGTAQKVADKHKTEALRAFVERFYPGRWDEIRPPDRQELKATTVLRLPVEEASTKIRQGPPSDDEDDYGREVWAGVIPVVTAFGEPVDDPRLLPGVEVPKYVRNLAKR